MGNINTPVSPTDNLSRQKLNRERLELTNTTNQKELSDIYRIVHANTKEYTFFALSPKLAIYLDTKQSLNRYKKTEITPCILSNYHGLKLI